MTQKHSHVGVNEAKKSGHKGKIFWNGGSEWIARSDRRLKTDICKEKDILSRLVKLDVKSYHWKHSPKSAQKSIGLIAQEVKPLFPLLVGELKDPITQETSLTLKYTSLGVLAVGAIKELKQEYDQTIATLKQEISTLKEKLVTA